LLPSGLVPPTEASYVAPGFLMTVTTCARRPDPAVVAETGRPFPFSIHKPHHDGPPTPGPYPKNSRWYPWAETGFPHDRPLRRGRLSGLVTAGCRFMQAGHYHARPSGSVSDSPRVGRMVHDGLDFLPALLRGGAALRSPAADRPPESARHLPFGPSLSSTRERTSSTLRCRRPGSTPVVQRWSLAQSCPATAAAPG